ncbi:hypothetical protein NFJ02_41g107610 [Pycnococcus provasolii]
MCFPSRVRVQSDGSTRQQHPTTTFLRMRFSRRSRVAHLHADPFSSQTPTEYEKPPAATNAGTPRRGRKQSTKKQTLTVAKLSSKRKISSRREHTTTTRAREQREMSRSTSSRSTSSTLRHYHCRQETKTKIHQNQRRRRRRGTCTAGARSKTTQLGSTTSHASTKFPTSTGTRTKVPQRLRRRRRGRHFSAHHPATIPTTTTSQALPTTTPQLHPCSSRSTRSRSDQRVLLYACTRTQTDDTCGSQSHADVCKWRCTVLRTTARSTRRKVSRTTASSTRSHRTWRRIRCTARRRRSLQPSCPATCSSFRQSGTLSRALFRRTS